ncbi:Hypothetical protein FKW44_008925 [Caligus rogercresseyi]|uniref:Uncharacterized protein n=1 Tax=Caligus rogercresseyi TaxID=217165 RepID=A0A7T8K6Y3_CALRO|nr:Hypothetical protein FKW44_008925 [Caligus rogercresseyi]
MGHLSTFIAFQADMAACFTKISFTDGRCDLSRRSTTRNHLLFELQQDTCEIVHGKLRI